MIELNDLNLENIHIGQKIQFKVVISKSMVDQFASLSGDHNPLHMDESYSKNAGFKERVCHGMLLASLFSRLVGMHLPGKNALDLSQSLRFISPCFIGDEVTIEGEVLKISLATRIITLKTKIMKESNINLVTGEAKVMVRGANFVIQ